MVYIPETVACVSEGLEKEVNCERCACVYAYPMQRAASASALDAGPTGAAAAVARARRKAKRSLEREDDPVACPACGHFQRNMTATVRRHHLDWMRTAAFWSIPLGLLAGVMGMVAIHTWVEDRWMERRLWALANGVMVAGFVLVPMLWGLRYVLARRIDLNRAGVDVERWTRGVAKGRVLREGQSCGTLIGGR